MSCKKNLTDDQLEAMFTATDEEMQQIKQPVECLIERTKHKCRRCTIFFSNEAALKQHHCEPQVKQRDAPTAVKPSIGLITWRSTCEVLRRALHTEANDNYVKRIWMDPRHWRMDPQHLRNR